MSTDFGGNESSAEWISQAEAARIKGVSRQAIHKLVMSGRLKSREIGGRILVSREDLAGIESGPSGRPRSEQSRTLERIQRLIEMVDVEDRKAILQRLREEFPIHPLEARLDTTAEVILEAIDRSGSLTIRMFRGVIAEAAFKTHVVDRLKGWSNQPISGNRPYDFDLVRGDDSVRVQVKLQRSQGGEPYRSEKVSRKFGLGPGRLVVETQKTRAGQDKTSGDQTRPYRFGEFDILAVAVYPSTRRWSSFRYTVANWLVPRPADPSLIEIYQPVSLKPDDDWTDDFETCVSWLKSRVDKTIRKD